MRLVPLVLTGLILVCAGVWALSWMVQGDQVLADRYRPSTGDPTWDAFLAETGELPAHDEVLP